MYDNDVVLYFPNNLENTDTLSKSVTWYSILSKSWLDEKENCMRFKSLIDS